MDLQAEKLELVRMVLDTDDKSIIKQAKSIFSKKAKTKKSDADLEKFYDGFRDGIREIKAAREGKTELQTLQSWLDEIKD